jgi:hypothetical protein
VVNPAAKRMYAFPSHLNISDTVFGYVVKLYISSLSQGGYTYCAVAALSLLKYERWDKMFIHALGVPASCSGGWF